MGEEKEEKESFIIRTVHDPDNPYAKINKRFLEDLRLSWKAKGLLAYLLTKPDYWKVVMEHLRKQSSDGVKSLRTAINELIFFGYMERFTIKEKGKFLQHGYYVYEICQKPLESLENYEKMKDSKRKKPLTPFRQVEKGRLVINDIVINELSTIPLQKNCKGEKGETEMCEKCDQLEKDIAIGTEFGFEFGVGQKRQTLKVLQQEHRNNPQENKKPSQDERISNMLSGQQDEYSDRLADYPESVRKPLHLFLKRWSFPPLSVPKKPKNSKGGLYATWIKGITELVQTSGEKDFAMVLDKVHERWDNRSEEYKTLVDMPQKLQSLFTAIVSEIRQEQVKEVAEKEKVTKRQEQPKEVFIAQENTKDLKDLLSSLK